MGPGVPVRSIETFYWLDGGYFLVSTYETTFGREPTQTGVNYWSYDEDARRFRIIFFSNNGPFREDGNRYEGVVADGRLTFEGPARFQSERADERLQRAFPDDRNTQERDISQVVVVVRATQGGIAAPVAEQRCRRWRATGATAVVTSTDGQPLISRDGDVDARPAPQSTATGASARPRRHDPRSGARCRCRPERGGALAAAARDEQDGERGDQGAASADQEGDLEAGVLGEPVRQDVGGDDAAGDLRADG
jgi:hypothetical protein